MGCEGDEFASIVSDVVELSVAMLANDVSDTEASDFLLFASVPKSTDKVVSLDTVSAVLARALAIVAAGPPSREERCVSHQTGAAAAFEALADRRLADKQPTTDVPCMRDTMLAISGTLNEMFRCVTIREFVERFEAALPAISHCDEPQVIYQYLYRGWDEKGQDARLRLLRCFADFASTLRTTCDVIRRGVIEFTEFRKVFLILSDCLESFEDADTVVAPVLGGVEAETSDFKELLRLLADTVAIRRGSVPTHIDHENK
jgi:hypothetical protein